MARLDGSGRLPGLYDGRMRSTQDEHDANHPGLTCRDCPSEVSSRAALMNPPIRLTRRAWTILWIISLAMLVLALDALADLLVPPRV